MLSRTASSTKSFSSSLPNPRYQSCAGHDARWVAVPCSNAAGVTGGGCGALSVAQPPANATHNAAAVSQRPQAAAAPFAAEELTTSACQIGPGPEYDRDMRC